MYFLDTLEEWDVMSITQDTCCPLEKYAHLLTHLLQQKIDWSEGIQGVASREKDTENEKTEKKTQTENKTNTVSGATKVEKGSVSRAS